MKIKQEDAALFIKDFGFCTLGTHFQLQKNGFFDKVKPKLCLQLQKRYTGEKLNVGLLESYINEHNNKTVNELHADEMENYKVLAMPQFNDIWAALPNTLQTGLIIGMKVMQEDKIMYEGVFGYITDNGKDLFVSISENNITEAACLLWLKLKKLGLL